MSDGVSDATNAHGEQYGRQRLGRSLEAQGHLGADDLVACLVGELTRWSEGTAPFDDLTLMVVAVKTES